MILKIQNLEGKNKFARMHFPWQWYSGRAYVFPKLTSYRRLIEVETTPCVYWVYQYKPLPLYTNFLIFFWISWYSRNLAIIKYSNLTKFFIPLVQVAAYKKLNRNDTVLKTTYFERKYFVDTTHSNLQSAFKLMNIGAIFEKKIDIFYPIILLKA